MKRPTAVTVFGILNIIFALFGFCGVAFQMVQPMLQENLQAVAEKAAKAAGEEVQQDPMQQAMQNNQTLKTVTKISTGIEAISSIVLLIAGIGLLKMKSWGRMLSIGYGIFDIISTIVFAVVTILIMKPLFEAQAEGIQGGPGAEALGGILIGSIGCGLIFALIYPILLLVFLTRSNVREAFAVADGGGGDDMMQIPDDNPYSEPMS